jgi:lipoyl(octanoyl) transferase
MIVFRERGLQHYANTYQEMKEFTTKRQRNDVADEIWFLEHYPVITLGVSGKIEDILTNTAIPIVQSDRGGQVTYHGIGQLIGYLLIDLRRRAMKAHTLIRVLENSLSYALEDFGITTEVNQKQPGIYVESQKKIASFGLKIVEGYTYHGFSLNVCMDLEPFKTIVPCGLNKIQMVNMIEYSKNITLAHVMDACRRRFTEQLA